MFLVCWIAVTCFALTYPFRRGPKVIERGYDKVIHTALFTVMALYAANRPPQQFQAADAGHLQVRHQDVDQVVLDPPTGLLRVGERVQFHSLAEGALHDRRQQTHHGGVVVDQQQSD